SRHPAGLPPAGTPDRGPHLHRLSGLLPIHHIATPPARPGPGAERAQRPREVCRRPDDRRPRADHRRTRTAADALHPAGTRTPAPDQPAQVPIAAPAATSDHHLRPTPPTPAVVKTFRSNLLIFNEAKIENGPNPRSRANLAAAGPLWWMPGLDQGWDPQGLAVVDGKLLVSAYQSDHVGVNRGPCRVF